MIYNNYVTYQTGGALQLQAACGDPGPYPGKSVGSRIRGNGGRGSGARGEEPQKGHI